MGPLESWCANSGRVESGSVKIKILRYRFGVQTLANLRPAKVPKHQFWDSLVETLV